MIKSCASCSVSSRMVWKPLTIWNLPLKSWPQICTRWEIQSSHLPLDSEFPILYASHSPCFSSVLSLLVSTSCATDKASAGWGEETADSVTRRPQVCASGGAEGGNAHTHPHITHTSEWADLRAVFGELLNMLPVSSEDYFLLFSFSAFVFCETSLGE